jgi:hypothetical protein
MKKRMDIELCTKFSLHQIGAVMTKLVLLLVTLLLVFSSAGVAYASTGVPTTLTTATTLATSTIPDRFILVGTDDASTNPPATGNILLYGFTPGQNPFASSTPTVVARFAGGIVQGLDILDYDNDGDLDFIAVVRFEDTQNDVWRYVPYFYENVESQYFSMTTIPNTLPYISGEWNAALADCTAADFNNPPDNLVDCIVAIGNESTPTVIYKYRNTGVPSTPFTRLDSTITANWAEDGITAVHARRMDSADFNGDGTGDFAIFDYPHGDTFEGEAIVYGHGSYDFGGINGHGGGEFPGAYIFNYDTPYSIATITAGQFAGNDTLPDIIVGGDDDGDPGQYWLYEQHAGAGAFEFTIAPTKVFDLNPDLSRGEPLQSGQPGAGVADAYDFNADNMMDVVATAGDMASGNISAGYTTIWYIQRQGPGTFYVSSPDTGLPVSPSSVIDIISTAQYGNVWSIAAPMTTKFGVG